MTNKLGKKFGNPLKPFFKNYQNIYITPDGELNNIPINVIRDRKSKEYLDGKFNIRLLTSGRDLIDIFQKKESSNNKPIIVGDPDFNISSELKYKNNQKRSFDLKNKIWTELPGTKIESEKIAKLTNGTLLTREDANTLEIQKRISPKIIHVASHAFYLENIQKSHLDDEKSFIPESPLIRSGIVLAGANNNVENINQDDGYLTSLEITNLNWQDTELVVISACSSAKGKIKTGEGVYGLKRAVAVAGANSTLLSLWVVDDKATANFMENFYIKLKNNVSRSQALYQTQEEFRQYPIKRWRHPNVWAAFQLSGDWRPIDF